MEYVYSLLVLSVLGGALAALLLIADRFLCNYGPCTINVNEEEPFTIDGGCTLLDALYAQRIFIPSACGGQGTCGFCKVQIHSGGGPTLPTELAFLNAEEMANHTRLACQVKVKEDMVIHVREDFLNVQEFTAVVTDARMVTADTREIHLDLKEPAEMDFRPGQYVQIAVPTGKTAEYRAYSICSKPSEKHKVELLIRLIPGGLGSTYMHNVQPGDEVVLTGPYGEFAMDEDPDSQIICVGGGCGMAPMRSILRHLSEVQPDRPCSLYFGARTSRDAMYMKEFEELSKKMPNLHVHYALSEPGEEDKDWDGETGFIHLSVQEHMAADGKRQAFLCGPPLMIEATMKVLEEKKLPREKVFYDEF